MHGVLKLVWFVFNTSCSTSYDSCVEVMSAVQVSPDALRYVESQPWPFPRSLMIAFRGKIDPCGPNGGPADGSAATLTMSSDARAAAAESGITQQEIQE